MTGRVFIGVSVAVQVPFASQWELRCNTRRKVSTTKCNISNTRRSVSFNIQTREGLFYLISKHEKECFIWYPNTEKWYIKYDESFIWYPNTRKSILFDIQTPRSDISNTRRSVSFNIQTRGRVFYLISKYREVIYQTREGVFHLISKQERECFILYPNTEE